MASPSSSGAPVAAHDCADLSVACLERVAGAPDTSRRRAALPPLSRRAAAQAPTSTARRICSTARFDRRPGPPSPLSARHHGFRRRPGPSPAIRGSCSGKPAADGILGEGRCSWTSLVSASRHARRGALPGGEGLVSIIVADRRMLAYTKGTAGSTPGRCFPDRRAVPGHRLEGASGQGDHRYLEDLGRAWEAMAAALERSPLFAPSTAHDASGALEPWRRPACWRLGSGGARPGPVHRGPDGRDRQPPP